MCYQPTPVEGLVVGGGYYVLDRLADPTEVVTLIGGAGAVAIVRGARRVEYAVPPRQLSPIPPDVFYRELRRRSESVSSL